MQQTFDIPLDNLPDLEEHLAILNRKATKLKCPQVTLEKGEITRHIEKDEMGFTHVHFTQAIALTGETIGIPGFDLVAVIDHTTAQENLIRSLPGMVEEGELVQYRTASPLCEHCNTLRRRNNTYIVRSEEYGLKQVGSDCLQDFFGFSPFDMASAFELLQDALALCKSAGDEMERGSGRSQTLDLASYLEWVSFSMRTSGWVSSTKARESFDGTVSTANQALFDMQDYEKAPSDKWGVFKDSPMDKDTQRVQQALDWIRTYQFDRSSDYMHNLFTVCATDYVNFKNVGIAASLLATYAKAAEVERKKSTPSTSQWIGQIGATITVVATVQSKRYIDGNYGVTTLYTLLDANGTILKWFCSGSCDLEENTTYTLKATIKGHDEWKGQRQTTITRAKIVQPTKTK